jgi:hypothetical protein
METNSTLFTAIAEKYIGVSETPVGSNCGPLIDRWNTNAHAPLGSFWCASFVSAIAMEWEAQSGIDWPLCISADCDVWLANARKNKCITPKGRPGDIVILVSGNDAYHIGIVAGYSEGGTLISIEGNSNNDGSRNGYMVAKRNNVYSGRNKDNVFFIHPWGLIQSGSDWKIVYGDKHIVALLHNSKTYAPVREFARLVTGADDTLSWEDGPVYNGKPLALQCILRDGKSYAAIRDLAGCFNFDCVVNSDQKKVYLKVKST